MALYFLLNLIDADNFLAKSGILLHDILLQIYELVCRILLLHLHEQVGVDAYKVMLLLEMTLLVCCAISLPFRVVDHHGVLIVPILFFLLSVLPTVLVTLIVFIVVV